MESHTVTDMKVLEIRNITRKEMPISYRRFYSGDVVLESGDHAPIETPVEFVLEHVATGAVEVQVTIADERIARATLDTVEEHVRTLENTGQLP